LSSRKEKTDVDVGHKRDTSSGDWTARGAVGVQASSKRPADIPDLNEGRENMPRSEKAQRLGESAGRCAGPIAKHCG